jgi:GNAT superfamily N-acetyltransferase
MPEPHTKAPTIRRATIDDAESIIEFNARMAFETERRALDGATRARGVRAALNDGSKGVYYVAEVDDAVVAQLLITHEWSDWRNGDLWWIQSVYVLPEHRQRGIFAALYRHVVLAARQDNAAGLRLYVERDNRPAQQTYQRLGMSMTHYAVMEEIF